MRGIRPTDAIDLIIGLMGSFPASGNYFCPRCWRDPPVTWKDTRLVFFTKRAARTTWMNSSLFAGITLDSSLSLLRPVMRSTPILLISCILTRVSSMFALLHNSLHVPFRQGSTTDGIFLRHRFLQCRSLQYTLTIKKLTVKSAFSSENFVSPRNPQL